MWLNISFRFIFVPFISLRASACSSYLRLNVCAPLFMLSPVGLLRKVCFRFFDASSIEKKNEFGICLSGLTVSYLNRCPYQRKWYGVCHSSTTCQTIRYKVKLLWICSCFLGFATFFEVPPFAADILFPSWNDRWAYLTICWMIKSLSILTVKRISFYFIVRFFGCTVITCQDAYSLIVA